VQLSHKAFHLGVFGMSGNGTTEYALRFIANARAAHVFLFDPEGEFSERLALPASRTVYELDQAIGTGWICFDPHIMFPGRLEASLEFFSKFALEASRRLPGRKFFVVDELGHYVTGHEVPQPLKTLVQTGRRSGVDGVFISQQPNELHNTVRNQLTEVVCFQLKDDCALEFPRKFGFDVEAVRNLTPFHYICRTKHGAETRG